VPRQTDEIGEIYQNSGENDKRSELKGLIKKHMVDLIYITEQLIQVKKGGRRK